MPVAVLQSRDDVTTWTKTPLRRSELVAVVKSTQHQWCNEFSCNIGSDKFLNLLQSSDVIVVEAGSSDFVYIPQVLPPSCVYSFQLN